MYDEPMTWGAYALWKFMAVLASIAMTGVLTIIGWASDASYCKVCARSMQWRLQRPHPLASRRYCPFHDDAEAP